MTRYIRATLTLTLIGLMWAAFTLGSVQSARAAGPVTDDNVAERLASAQTAADHEALAAYFRAEAAAAGEKVKLHQAMLASATKKVAGKSWVSWELHCNGLIKMYKDAQKEAEGLAAEHEAMAKVAAK